MILDDCNMFIPEMTMNICGIPTRWCCRQELGLSLITNACLFGACNTARCTAFNRHARDECGIVWRCMEMYGAYPVYQGIS